MPTEGSNDRAPSPATGPDRARSSSPSKALRLSPTKLPPPRTHALPAPPPGARSVPQFRTLSERITGEGGGAAGGSGERRVPSDGANGHGGESKSRETKLGGGSSPKRLIDRLMPRGARSGLESEEEGEVAEGTPQTHPRELKIKGANGDHTGGSQAQELKIKGDASRDVSVKAPQKDISKSGEHSREAARGNNAGKSEEPARTQEGRAERRDRPQSRDGPAPPAKDDRRDVPPPRDERRDVPPPRDDRRDPPREDRPRDGSRDRRRGGMDIYRPDDDVYDRSRDDRSRYRDDRDRDDRGRDYGRYRDDRRGRDHRYGSRSPRDRDRYHDRSDRHRDDRYAPRDSSAREPPLRSGYSGWQDVRDPREVFQPDGSVRYERWRDRYELRERDARDVPRRDERRPKSPRRRSKSPPASSASQPEPGEVDEEEGEIPPTPPLPPPADSRPPTPPPPEDSPPTTPPPPPPGGSAPPPPPKDESRGRNGDAHGNREARGRDSERKSAFMPRPPHAPNRNLLDPVTRVTTPVGTTPAPPKLFRFPTAAEERETLDREFVGTTTLAAYDVGSKLGEGTFGVVTKAVELATKRAVALKKLLVHNQRDGVSVTTVREIKILKEMRHTNIVPLLDMVVERKIPTDRRHRGEVFMVFPFMDHDLCGLLLNRDFKASHSICKLLLRQILEGVNYMHVNNIVHRDLKTANILVNNEGHAMIADFGLARSLGTEPMPAHSPHEYTNMVVTRWYRAPELLLGDTQYGTAVDVWSIGCMLGEMYHRKPIFAGESERDQLHVIFSHLPLSSKVWPGWDDLPGFEKDKTIAWQRTPLDKPLLEVAKKWQMDRVGVDLLLQLLQLDPSKRPTAAQALDHPWFFTEPLPAKLGKFQALESSHEMTSRREPANNHLRPPGPPQWAGGPRPPPNTYQPRPRYAQHAPQQFHPPPSTLPSGPAYPQPAAGRAPRPPFRLAGGQQMGMGGPNMGGMGGPHGGMGGPGFGGPGRDFGPGGQGHGPGPGMGGGGRIPPAPFRLAGGARPAGPSFAGGGPGGPGPSFGRGGGQMGGPGGPMSGSMGGGPPGARLPKRPGEEQGRGVDKRPRTEARDAPLPY